MLAATLGDVGGGATLIEAEAWRARVGHRHEAPLDRVGRNAGYTRVPLTKTTENGDRALRRIGRRYRRRMFDGRDRDRSRDRVAQAEANGAGDVGSSSDSPPRSSLDSPPASSLDSPPGTSLDAPELSLDGERDAVCASFDEFGSGTLDSADEELRRYLRE